MQVLTDTHGRILTRHDPDGDVRTAVVWVPGDSRIDWDDASDQELVTLLGKYGYNDALAIENNNVTINDNGESETLTWDSTAMDFTVDVDMFQNGAQNMFFRTVNDGSRDVTVLCDADGKAIIAPTLGEYTGVLFSVTNNGTKIDTITSDSSISAAAVIQACGGSINVTALDAGASVFLLVLGTHVQFCNADDLTTTPGVTLLGGPVIAAQGVAQVFKTPDCNSYFDGNSNICYVRLNNGVAKNGEQTWYDGSDNEHLWIKAPSDAEPTLPYGVAAYVDWLSSEFDNSIPAGSVLKCISAPGSTVANPKTIFE